MSVLPATLLLAAALGGATAASACGLENPSSINIGLLNLAYPDALHVRTAVWVAQRDGILAPVDGATVIDAQSPQFVLQQMALFRAIQGQFLALKSGMDASAARAVPSFSVVLLGIVLWTRFEAGATGLDMTVHAPGPGGNDVVVVTDVPVLAALADGQLTAAEAHRHGLIRLYGSPQELQEVERFLDRAVRGKGDAVERAASTMHGVR